MRKKTLEEKRETNRLKQARWRARHRGSWLYRQQKLAVYGKAARQKDAWEAPEVTDNRNVTELRYEECDDEGRVIQAPPVVALPPASQRVVTPPATTNGVTEGEEVDYQGVKDVQAWAAKRRGARTGIEVELEFVSGAEALEAGIAERVWVPPGIEVEGF